MKCFILVFAFLLAQQSFAAEPAVFDHTPFLKACGGVIYPACDTVSMNQETIYNEALKLATTTNRKLLTIVGFDECHHCQVLEERMKSDTQQMARLNQNFVVVRLFISAESTKKITNKFHVKVVGAPTAIVLNPSGQAETFFPTSSYTLGKIVDKIESISKGAQNQLPWFPTENVGTAEQQNRVRLSMLKKPIALDTSILPLVDIKYRSDSKDANAVDYFHQGVFHIFTFNWIDAVRSLKTAIDRDPNFVEAYIYLSNALWNLQAYDEYAGAIDKADEIAKKVAVKKSVQALLKLKKLEVCNFQESLCKKWGMPHLDDEKELKLQSEKLSQDFVKVAMSDDNINGLVFYESTLMEVRMLEMVLTVQSNHIGAHHFLIHAYESANDYKSAEGHAATMASLAPNSAHAQHMYGHILPKVGKWDQAIQQFLLADKIHLKWIAENDSNPEEDWHYRHNLDLMAHAFNWNKNYDLAGKNWSLLCDLFGGRYCDSYTSFLISIGKLNEAEAVLVKQRTDAVSYLLVQYLKDPKNLKTKSQLTEYLNSTSETDIHSLLLVNILYPKERKASSRELSEYIEKTLNQAGFDSWSVSILRAQVYAYVADTLGQKPLAANIRLAAASVGFVCKSSKK